MVPPLSALKDNTFFVEQGWGNEANRSMLGLPWKTTSAVSPVFNHL